MMKLVPLILATMFVQQLPANQANTPSPSTYLPGQGGVTAPMLLHETKPKYTAEAMRARIQGVIVLECVVMPDGLVGNVRVVRSLDSVYGLDDQAVKALKEWRFQPGMKDGLAVPVLVTIEMSYALGPRNDAAPPSAPSVAGAAAPVGWPDAFGDAGTVASSTAFADGALHQPTFDLAFAYPSTWSMLESSAGVTLHAEDAKGTRAVTISSRERAQFSLTEPVSQSVLDSFSLAARAGAAFIRDLRVIKSGQVRRDRGLWIWFEMAAPSLAAWNAPPALADRLRSGYGGIHVWSFATTAAGQSISVFCTVVHRAGLSDADQEEQIRRAALEFNEILRRISIQPR
ncbi:MAG: energy transducer TonB [Vicinamibacterales bacterium]